MGATAPSVVLAVSDLVVTDGPRGREKILVAGVNLRVTDGEAIAIEVDDPAAGQLLIDALTGRRRPVYGVIEPTGSVLPQLSPGAPVGPGGPLVIAAGTQTVPPTWFDEMRRVRSAVVAIGSRGALAELPVDRRLRLAEGHLQPVRPRDIHVPADRLRERVQTALTEAGTATEVAALVARVLVDADVRGHSSHGVQLLPMYLNRLARGGIQAKAEPRWLTRTGPVRIVDAGGGFGQVAAELAAAECARVSAELGICAVGVRGNNHIGMLAAYREPFVRHGVVGLLLNISGPSVAAPGAGKASMGNNAVCLISPDGPGGQPLITDFATGIVASGKIRDAAARGHRVPPGWLVDAGGRSTTDPAALDQGGAVPVFGDHKGLCVSIIVEVLAGMLGGHTVSPLVHKQRHEPETPMGCAQLFIGLYPPAFFVDDLGRLSDTLVSAVARGYLGEIPEVFFPEQQEQHRTATAEELGVLVPSGLAAQLGLHEAVVTA